MADEMERMIFFFVEDIDRETQLRAAKTVCAWAPKPEDALEVLEILGISGLEREVSRA